MKLRFLRGGKKKKKAVASASSSSSSVPTLKQTPRAFQNALQPPPSAGFAPSSYINDGARSMSSSYPPTTDTKGLSSTPPSTNPMILRGPRQDLDRMPSSRKKQTAVVKKTKTLKKKNPKHQQEQYFVHKNSSNKPMSRRTAMAQELDALDQRVSQNNWPTTLYEVLSGGGGGCRPATSAGGRSVQSSVSTKSTKSLKKCLVEAVTTPFGHSDLPKTIIPITAPPNNQPKRRSIGCLPVQDPKALSRSSSSHHSPFRDHGINSLVVSKRQGSMLSIAPPKNSILNCASRSDCSQIPQELRSQRQGPSRCGGYRISFHQGSNLHESRRPNSVLGYYLREAKGQDCDDLCNRNVTTDNAPFDMD